jgi:two-component system, sensor histidine kinase and response regulator
MTTILIIEDEALIRESVKEILIIENFDVLDAENGTIGFELAVAQRPDLILCDIAMPGEMNGYDVLARLRASPEMAKIPFIFLSAKTTRPEQRKGMQLGADDYLTKPFTAQELLLAVHAQIGKRAALQQAYGQDIDKLRETIIYALPHELRTPLYSISGYASTLMEAYPKFTPDMVLSNAERIFANAARLNQLIEKYLLYAQVVLMQHDPVLLAQLTSENTPQSASTVEVAAVYWAQTYQRESDLKLSIRSASVNISETHLSNIVAELMDNAFKFSDTGTTVSVIAGKVNGEFSLQIMDHGHGMSEGQIASIGVITQFNRQLFEQSGTGLGLAICKRLVSFYNGRFTINSQSNIGTTVTVSLPLTVA